MKFLIYILLLISLLGCKNNGKSKTREYRTYIWGIYYICDDYYYVNGSLGLRDCKEETSSYFDPDPNPVKINILNATDVLEVEL